MRSFPYSYAGEISFYKPENYANLEVDKGLISWLNTGPKIALDKRNAIGGIIPSLRSVVHIKQETKGTTLTFFYRISLFESNLVLLLAIVFSIFFNYNQKPGLTWLFVIAGLVFYFLNVSRISTNIKQNLKRIIGQTLEPSQESLWLKQQVWMKDPLSCSGCGETLNEYSAECLQCGLTVIPKKKAPNNLNTTFFEKVNFTYIKKKK